MTYYRQEMRSLLSFSLAAALAIAALPPQASALMRAPVGPAARGAGILPGIAAPALSITAPITALNISLTASTLQPILPTINLSLTPSILPAPIETRTGPTQTSIGLLKTTVAGIRETKNSSSTSRLLEKLFSGSRSIGNPETPGITKGASFGGRTGLLRTIHGTKKSRAPGPAPHTGAQDDPDGSRMAAVLKEISKPPALGQVEKHEIILDFTPSPASLKKIAWIGKEGGGASAYYEVALYRLRGSKRWILVKGGSDDHRYNVATLGEDYDIAMHNHPDIPIGGYSEYPSPQDLVVAAGIDARFYVISVAGLVEWSSKVPYRSDPNKFLGKEDSPGNTAQEWMNDFEGTILRKLFLRALFPAFYPTILRRSGIDTEKFSWNRVTQTVIDR